MLYSSSSSQNLSTDRERSYERKSFHRGGRPFDSESTPSSHSDRKRRKRRKRRSSDSIISDYKSKNKRCVSPKKPLKYRQSSRDRKKADKFPTSPRNSKRFYSHDEKNERHRKSKRKSKTRKDVEIVPVGELVAKRYSVVKVLGEGSFGQVLECKDHHKNETVALKALKPLDNYKHCAKHEMSILHSLSDVSKNPDISCCINALDFFEWNKYYFIVFPKLGESVFTFLQKNNYQPYSIEHSASITLQLCSAVKFLNKLGLTHTDLKPENILFVNDNYITSNMSDGSSIRILKDTRIRVIDFGSATHATGHHSRTIQTRHYRAPEVILELGWSFAADIWSIGCILFELITGECMFMTHDNLEHLAMMERVLGPLPKQMIKNSPRNRLFYKGKLDWDSSSSDGRYVRKHLKPLGDYWFSSEKRRFRSAIDLVKETLIYNPEERIHIRDVFTHPFLSTSLI